MTQNMTHLTVLFLIWSCVYAFLFFIFLRLTY